MREQIVVKLNALSPFFGCWVHKRYHNESYDLEWPVLNHCADGIPKKGKRKVQGVPQSQTAALPRPQEEEETDKSKQAQTEQTYEKH